MLQQQQQQQQGATAFGVPSAALHKPAAAIPPPHAPGQGDARPATDHTAKAAEQGNYYLS